MSQQIITSQIGYYPEDIKRAVKRADIREGIPSKFTVVNMKTGKTVYEGFVSDTIKNSSADETNNIICLVKILQVTAT